MQYIKSDKFQQMGYLFSKLFAPRHLYQFANDAAVLTGQEYENQILLNAFTAWCTWCNMIIRVDKFMQMLDQGQRGYFHKFDYGCHWHNR